MNKRKFLNKMLLNSICGRNLRTELETFLFLSPDALKTYFVGSLAKITKRSGTKSKCNEGSATISFKIRMINTSVIMS